MLFGSSIGEQEITMSGVLDIKINDLPSFKDQRGNLIVADLDKLVPFPVVRLFYIRDVPVNTIRGQHAHRRCRQYVICQSGRVLMDIADATHTRRVELKAGQAVLMESGIFHSEMYLDSDSIVLVLCDQPYDRSDYIDSMDELRSSHVRR